MPISNCLEHNSQNKTQIFAHILKRNEIMIMDHNTFFTASFFVGEFCFDDCLVGSTQSSASDEYGYSKQVECHTVISLSSRPLSSCFLLYILLFAYSFFLSVNNLIDRQLYRFGFEQSEIFQKKVKTANIVTRDTYVCYCLFLKLKYCSLQV